ncbi:MAG: hypothetical protein J7549_19985 [Variovorax sp.]|nr:hypothetical protein [Variovorax sp.]
MGLLSTFLGNVDLSRYAVDDPFPQDLPVTEGWKSPQELFAGLARREHLGLARPAHPNAR